MDRDAPPDVGLAPPKDVAGRVIDLGDTIAYPKGAASDGSDIVVGFVEEIKDGADRWKRPCRVLMVRPLLSSEPRMSDKRRRIWMVSKTVILKKRDGSVPALDTEASS